MRNRPPLSLLALLLAGATPAGAQVCTGLRAHANGVLAVGLVSTDGMEGASGAGAVRYRRHGVEIQYREFDQMDLGTPRELGLHTSHRVRTSVDGRAATCLVAGVAHFQTSYDPSPANLPDFRADRHQRLRVPFALAMGQEFGDEAGEIAVIPFGEAGAVYQTERYEEYITRAPHRDTRVRPTIALGVGLRAGPLVLRARVDRAWLGHHTLDGRRVSTLFGAQAGVGF